jgi:hypothetical protein
MSEDEGIIFLRVERDSYIIIEKMSDAINSPPPPMTRIMKAVRANIDERTRSQMTGSTAKKVKSALLL